jgi:hypothetical protein
MPHTPPPSAKDRTGEMLDPQRCNGFQLPEHGYIGVLGEHGFE